MSSHVMCTELYHSGETSVLHDTVVSHRQHIANHQHKILVTTITEFHAKRLTKSANQHITGVA